MIIDTLLERIETDPALAARWRQRGYLDDNNQPTDLLRRMRRTMVAGSMIGVGGQDPDSGAARGE